MLHNDNWWESVQESPCLFIVGVHNGSFLSFLTTLSTTKLAKKKKRVNDMMIRMARASMQSVDKPELVDITFN